MNLTKPHRKDMEIRMASNSRAEPVTQPKPTDLDNIVLCTVELFILKIQSYVGEQVNRFNNVCANVCEYT